MPYLEYDTTDTRQRIPIQGRGLFLTNSSTVEFMGEEMRNLFPLLPSTPQALSGQHVPPLMTAFAGFSWLLPIEAKGFLLIAHGAFFNLQLFAAYERFDYSPDRAAMVAFRQAPFVVASSSVGDLYGPTGDVFYYKLIFEDGSTSFYSSLSRLPSVQNPVDFATLRQYNLVRVAALPIFFAD